MTGEAHGHVAGGVMLHWPWDYLVLASLVVGAGLFARGVTRIRGRHPSAIRTGSVFAYAAATFTIAVALLSPLDPLSDVLFSAHMTQHELLMLVAAPLFALARPLVPILWSLPATWRWRLGTWSRTRAWQSAWRTATGPIFVWVAHALALSVWHVPRLFEAALRSEAVHALQHASFFVTAFLFWWAVVHGRYGRIGYGAAVLFVFTAGVYNTALGALLTVATRLWYPVYADRSPPWGLGPLADQQLAGLIMWVPAGVVFIVAGLALFAAWIGESEYRVSLGRSDEAVIAGHGQYGGTGTPPPRP
jgi:putative membrane protein